MQEEPINKSLNAILDGIIRLANFDYTTQVEVDTSEDTIQAVATGINLLMQELEANSVSRIELEGHYSDFRSAMNHAPNAMIVANKKGKVVFFNQCASEMFKIDAHKAAGLSIEEFMPESYREKHVGYRENYASDPSRIDMGRDKELWALTSDGQKIPVDIQIGPVVWEGNKAAMAVIRDITEEKKTAQKLNNWVQELEKEVALRTRQIKLQNKDLNDSIVSASYLQKAFFPEPIASDFLLKQMFVLNMPKDVLSGDFFWGHKNVDSNTSCIAVGDCTGHGVPGALMTVLAVQLLEKYILNPLVDYSPSDVIHSLNDYINNLFGVPNEGFMLSSGMELALLKIDSIKKVMTYSGAGMALYRLREGEMMRFAPNKASVGGLKLMNDVILTQHEIPIRPRDCFYMFSDGIRDQFGGENDKKLGTKNVIRILTEAAVLPMDEQKTFLRNKLDAYMKTTPQTDDIIVVGLEF